MLNLREYRAKAKGLPDLINTALLVGEPIVDGKPMGIVLTKSGMLLAGFSYAGPDQESSSTEDLGILSSQINSALSRRGTGWAVWVDLIRQPIAEYPSLDECHFSDPVSLLIDQERRLQHEAEGAHFESRTVAVFGFTIPSDAESRLIKAVVTNASVASDSLGEHVKKFAGEIENILGVFRGYTSTTPLTSSGLLTHIHGALTGDYHRINPPKIPAFLDATLGAHDLVGGFEPKIDGQEIRVIGIAGWPQETWPTILESLQTLPFAFRYSLRFLFLDPAESQKRLTVYRRNWFQKRHSLASQVSQSMGGDGGNFVNSDAISMAADADAAIAEAASGSVRYGYMTAVFVVHADDPRTAAERVKMLRQYLDNGGFVSRLESVNALEAWLGSVPGQTFENVRRPLMSSMNLADIMPTTSIWAGSTRNPNPMQRGTNGKGAPPLLYAATTGNTPYRLSLHVDDLGHTFVAGPTGAGKSTLLALIAAQQLRYENARVFAFDKGLSLLPLTLAVGGAHYQPGDDHSDLSFAPLSRIADGPAERAWAEEFIEGLCILQGVAINPARRKAIHAAIESLAEQESKSISDFVNTIQDDEIRAALSFYTLSGRAGRLIDAQTDTLDLDGSRFATFEIGALMGEGGSNKLVAVPVLLYLFHRIEQSLDGRPTLILLDEAWALLDHPVFSAKIREWLKVLRKANAAVVFATQSLADLKDNPLRPVLMESCPTKILLPNREAANQNLAPLYHDIGLNDWQIRLLQTAISKSDYYIVSPEGRRRIKLQLGPVALAFVGASGKKDLARVAALNAEHGSKWPIMWLRERLPVGYEGWVEELERLFSV